MMLHGITVGLCFLERGGAWLPPDLGRASMSRAYNSSLFAHCVDEDRRMVSLLRSETRSKRSEQIWRKLNKLVTMGVQRAKYPVCFARIF